MSIKIVLEIIDIKIVLEIIIIKNLDKVLDKVKEKVRTKRMKWFAKQNIVIDITRSVDVVKDERLHRRCVSEVEIK